ncbi:MAG: hypothetical protein LBL94_05315 [Prevotellaceae bacterium]|jgi:hypothetical protein|nr:hypothetical protein [Prevotellaceae bacterium]
MKEKLPVQVADEQETLARLMQAYVNGSAALSEHEKALFDELCEADELQKSFGFPSAEARAKELAKRRDISLSKARGLLRKAADFFNSVDSADPTTGARVILHQIDYFLSLCETSNNFKQAAAFMKLKVQVYVELASKKTIDPKLLQQNNYTFNIGGKLKQLGEGITRAELDDEVRRWKVSAREKKRIISEVYPDDDEQPA